MKMMFGFSIASFIPVLHPDTSNAQAIMAEYFKKYLRSIFLLNL
jgi:hypothetical protein